VWSWHPWAGVKSADMAMTPQNGRDTPRSAGDGD
jgi:hypothetical protein